MSAKARDSGVGAKHASPAAQSDYGRTVKAHAAYYSDLTARVGRLLRGAGHDDGGSAQRHALRSLSLELENTLAALNTALTWLETAWALSIATYLWQLLDTLSEFSTITRIYGYLVSAAEAIDDVPLRQYAHLGKSLGAFRQGRYVDAQKEAIIAAELAATGEHQSCYGDALRFEAMGRQYMGQHQEARALHDRSLAAYINAGDLQGRSYTLSCLGVLEITQGNLDAARAAELEAAAIRKKMGNVIAEAASLSNLGRIEYSLGNLEAQKELEHRALEIFRSVKSRRGEALSLATLGLAESDAGNYSVAGELIQQALSIQTEIGDRSGQAASINILGISAYDCGEYVAASALFRQALAILREISDRYGESWSLSRLGFAEHAVGNYAAARAAYAEVIPLQQAMGFVGLQSTCAAASALLILMNRLDLGGAALYCALSGLDIEAGEILSEAKPLVEHAQAALVEYVEAGAITADALEQLKAQGEALSLDELAEFTLSALAEAGAGAGPDG